MLEALENIGAGAPNPQLDRSIWETIQMTGNRENAEEIGSNQTDLYRETIPFGKVYHGVMGGVILLLVAGLIVFGITGLYAGVIALALTLPFVGWVYVGCRKTDLVVTRECFEVRYWFAKLIIPVNNIASVRVRDEIVLPPSYQGHIKVGYGWHSWRDLKVMVCRRGLPVVEMNTQDGVTVIVTPLRANKLVELLSQRIDQRSNSEGTEQNARLCEN